ncbi:MAG: ERF family protein [Blautia sp.]|nr:ERF family protein [Blautia sp.]
MENLGIYKAITGVMADVGAVGKNGVNRQQGFKFRSIDDVMNALHPAMVKNKVFTVPEILEQTREVKTTKNGTELMFSLCKIRYTFYAEDGSFVEAVVIGEGMDSGDKATNKAMAIAYKYACFQVFCIPTEEMVDPDSECPETQDAKAEKGRKSKSETKAGTTAKAGKTAEPDSGKEQDPLVTDAMVKTIIKNAEELDVPLEQIMKLFAVKNLQSLTITQYKKIMKKFDLTRMSREAQNE